MIRCPARPVSLAILGLLAGCGGHAAEESEPSAVVAVEMLVVTPQTFESTIEAVGTLVAEAGRSAAIAAPVNVRISRVLVVVGQRVRTGQPLVELDRTAIEATLRSAEAAVAAADAAAARANRLVTAGVLPRRDAEQATAEAARAHEALTTARRTADLAHITAPFDAVVTRVTALPGATADPAIPLVELTDPTAIDVVFQLSSANAAAVRLGQRVVLTGESPADSLGDATIADVGGVVDSTTRSVTVRASTGKSVRMLRIGETVRGRIVVSSSNNSIVVPVAALVPSSEGFHLFVVDSAGIAHEREVTVDGQHDGIARISSGLSAGERIVTTGAYGLDDSVAVVAPGAKAKTP